MCAVCHTHSPVTLTHAYQIDTYATSLTHTDSRRQISCPQRTPSQYISTAYVRIHACSVTPIHTYIIDWYAKDLYIDASRYSSCSIGTEIICQILSEKIFSNRRSELLLVEVFRCALCKNQLKIFHSTWECDMRCER